MALATVAIRYPLTVLLLRALPRARASVPLAAGIAAAVSVAGASLAFVGYYALGGTTDVPIGWCWTGAC